MYRAKCVFPAREKTNSEAVTPARCVGTNLCTPARCVGTNGFAAAGGGTRLQLHDSHGHANAGDGEKIVRVKGVGHTSRGSAIPAGGLILINNINKWPVGS